MKIKEIESTKPIEWNYRIWKYYSRWMKSEYKKVLGLLNEINICDSTVEREWKSKN